MSAQALNNTVNYPTMTTGFVILDDQQATNVFSFTQPFPVDTLPVVFMQNIDATNVPGNYVSLSNIDNVGFTATQIFPTGGQLEPLVVNYVAIYIPSTIPIPP
jgi:hypothetical protein